MSVRPTCGQRKCGEFNMLVCVAAPHSVGAYPNDGHCYVVDHANDYPWRKRKSRAAQLGGKRP